MSLLRLVAWAAAATSVSCAGSCARDRSQDACPDAGPAVAAAAVNHSIRTIFVIVMENEDWSSIEGNPSAPYINSVLLPRFAHAENYRNGGLHPSLGNYIALEAGNELGVRFDTTPAHLHLSVGCHLASYLEAVGLSWKAYEEGIRGDSCPLDDAYPYAVRHDPFVYFDDVAGTPKDRGTARCTQHIRPYRELSRDLVSGEVARYNFITPDLCNSGHDRCSPLNDPVGQSDAWLARELPVIMQSRAYSEGGAIFITWDEGASGESPLRHDRGLAALEARLRRTAALLARIHLADGGGGARGHAAAARCQDREEPVQSVHEVPLSSFEGGAIRCVAPMRWRALKGR